MDVAGNKMDLIREDEKTTERINRKIFQRWLKGEGQPTTWSIFIDVLFKVKLSSLAEEIGSTVTRNYCNVSSLPHAYSEEITDAVSTLKERYRRQKVVQFNLLEKFNAINLPFFEIILRDHDEHGTSTSDKILDNVLNDAIVHIKLLINGLPGSGKTTLMRHIAKKWAEGESLQVCQILFIIYLDKGKKDDYTNLRYLLGEQYEDIMDVPTIANEISSKKGNGTCLLLDAFDENDIKRDFVNDLIFNNQFPNLMCIITSRPDNDLNKINASVDIVGFQPKKLDSYLQTFITDKSIKERVKKLWKDKQIKDLCKLPLHMAMIVFIAQTIHASSITTKTQIYTAFMNATIMHYERDHPRWNTVFLRQCVLDHNW